MSSKILEFVEDTASMVQPFTCSASNHTSDVSSTFSSWRAQLPHIHSPALSRTEKFQAQPLERRTTHHPLSCGKGTSIHCFIATYLRYCILGA